MTLKTKLGLVATASSALLLSALLVDIIYFRIFVVLAMMFLYYYFAFRIKTVKPGAREVQLANDSV
jgi:cytochrome bd-type quinol oxidase subunit 2